VIFSPCPSARGWRWFADSGHRLPGSEIQDFGGGVEGAEFCDPDGNTVDMQEMAWRKSCHD
jgi:hypothetical protein